MSGCVEDILIDLSEPVEEQPSYISVSDSIELLRDDSQAHVPQAFGSPANSGLLVSPVKDLLLESPPLVPIDKETFDFDLPLTPVTVSDKSASSHLSAEEDEEEVYFGPVGFKERCVATAIISQTKERKALSPLNSRQFAEICKEANAVASRISSAASSSKRAEISKENLNVAKKQLNLDNGDSIFKVKASNNNVLSLPKVSSNLAKKQLSLDKADGVFKVKASNINVLSSQSSSVLKAGKNFCDTLGESVRDCKPMETDILPLINIDSADVLSSQVGIGSGEDPDTPSRRHTRSSTFTVDKTPLENLSPNKRRSLPVVDQAIKEPNKKLKPNESTEDQPKQEKQSAKGGRSLLRKPSIRVAGGASAIPNLGLKKAKPASPEPAGDDSQLSAPNQSGTSLLSNPSTLQSKLKPLGATSSETNGKTSLLPSKPSQLQLAPKSGLPGPKIKTAPATKMQLRKPSGLQRPTLGQINNEGSSAKAGPIKAFVPAGPTVLTPNKEDKKVQPKNLSSSFTTPVKSGSTSSMESPMSSKRRSFLPTPNKIRTGSTSSIPSPSGSRTSSTSSMRSLESPLVNTSLSRVRNNSGGNRMISKDDLKRNIGNASPALKKKQPPVTNTPNMPKKKVSPWSPLEKKKPFDLVDEAIMCTKKLRR